MSTVMRRIRNICPDGSTYETNKFQLKTQVEGGTPPWVVAWADDVSEKDVLLGIVSVGVSVIAQNPGPFIAWTENLISSTIETLTSDAQGKFPNEIKSKVVDLATDAIKQAIKGQSTREVLKQFDTVDFKAGAIRYSGKNKLCGKTISNTWGMKPYVAFRWR